jgi:folate-binding protein YgfZ
MSDRSPIHDATALAGAAFVDDAGWLMPAHYGDAAAEYRQAHEGAALFDLSHRGKVELTGKEAAVFLHNITTNDIKNIPYSHACEVFLCNAQARVLAWGLIYHLKVFEDHLFLAGHDAFWLDVDPGLSEKIAAHLDRYLISEDVVIADRTRSHAQLHLAGPRAETLMAEQGVNDLGPGTLMQAGWGEGTIQFRRYDRLGVPGYDIVCPAAAALAQWQSLRDRQAVPAGLQAYDVLRVEAGTPVYGKDMDENSLAPEVGRTPQAISYTKGCYLGQEPIVRIRDLGHVNRTLTGLTIAGTDPVAPGSKLSRDGKEAGQLTSVVVSPRLGCVVALAYVRRGHSDPGTVLQVESAGTQRQASVVSLPFSGCGAS